MAQDVQLATPPLRFRVGEYAFWIWRPRLVPIDCSDRGAVEWERLAKESLNQAADGFLCHHVASGSQRKGVYRQGGWLVYVRGEEKSFFIEIEGTFEDYLNRFTAKKRRDLKRIIRHFPDTDRGPAFTVAKRPEEMEEFQRRAVEISRQTYQAKLFGAGMPEGHEYLEKMKDFAARGLARGYLLRLEGMPVAFGWCAGQGDQLNYIVTGYLPKHARLSPGTALLCLLLEDVFREKAFRVFSFGTGEIWYKEYFSTGWYSFVDAIVLRPTWRHHVLARLHFVLERGNEESGRLLERWGVKRAIKRIVRRWAGAGAPAE